MISNTVRKLIELNARKLSIAPEVLEDEMSFLIDTNYIAAIDKGISDPTCRPKLIEYFQRKDCWVDIKEVLFEMYPDERNHIQTAKEAYDIISNDPGFKYNLDRFYFNDLQGQCLDLCKGISLGRSTYIDRDFFDFFFSYRLSKRELERVRHFLEYNLLVHFGNDTAEFIKTMTLVIIPKYTELIGEARIRIIKVICEDLSPECLSNNQQAEDTNQVDINGIKPNAVQLASYYYCLHCAKEIEMWGDGEKMKYLKNIGRRHKLSEMHFYNTYKSVEKNPSVSKENYAILLQMLSTTPSARLFLESKFNKFQ